MSPFRLLDTLYEMCLEALREMHPFLPFSNSTPADPFILEHSFDLEALDVTCGLSEKSNTHVFREFFQDLDDWDPADPDDDTPCTLEVSGLAPWEKELPNLILDGIADLNIHQLPPYVSPSDLILSPTKPSQIQSSDSSIPGAYDLKTETLPSSDYVCKLEDDTSCVRILDTSADLQKVVEYLLNLNLDTTLPTQPQPILCPVDICPLPVESKTSNIVPERQEQASQTDDLPKTPVQPRTKRQTKDRPTSSTELTYPCGVPGCPEVFRRESDRKRHRRCAAAHKDWSLQPEHVCATCKKVFARLDSRNRHQKLRACFKRASPHKRQLSQQ